MEWYPCRRAARHFLLDPSTCLGSFPCGTDMQHSERGLFLTRSLPSLFPSLDRPSLVVFPDEPFDPARVEAPVVVDSVVDRTGTETSR